ncbi:hypothetical protein GCM10009678_76430 [Actinomadura kijaniata]
MDRADDVGTGDVEDLVAALVALEVLHGGVAVLEHRPHTAVGHDDAVSEGLAQRLRSGRSAHDRTPYPAGPAHHLNVQLLDAVATQVTSACRDARDGWDIRPITCPH